MTKREIINKIMETTNFSKRRSHFAVDMVFSIIKKNLAEGKSVKISGFGVFDIRRRIQRMGRNPRTGVEVPIVEGKSLKFRAGKILKKKVSES